MPNSDGAENKFYSVANGTKIKDLCGELQSRRRHQGTGIQMKKWVIFGEEGSWIETTVQGEGYPCVWRAESTGTRCTCRDLVSNEGQDFVKPRWPT